MIIDFPEVAGASSSRKVAGASSSQPRYKRSTLNARQKALLHIYKAAAGLSEAEYRAILRRTAGVPSAADPGFTQSGFDRAMAAIEGELAVRVETGRVPRPSPRHIPRLYYWRGKAAAPGRVNIRQRHTIEETWSRLAQYIGTAATQEYLQGIIAKATGRAVLPHHLTATEAGHVIDAIKSRLAAAIRAAGASGNVARAPLPARQEKELEPCPF